MKSDNCGAEREYQPGAGFPGDDGGTPHQCADGESVTGFQSASWSAQR